MATITHPTDNSHPGGTPVNEDTQPDLLDLLNQIAAGTGKDDAATADDDAELTPGEKFERYHRANPAVYAVMCGLAREWKARTGRPKLGINSLVERVRWEVAIRTNDPEFKINNSHAPFYSRLIMAQEADLNGLFEVRRSIADQTMDLAA